MTTQTEMQHHMPEGPYPQSHHCENLRTCIKLLK